MTRLLLVCLSEAAPELLLPWAHDGRLPALQSLVQDGASASTTYGIPYLLTPQLWTTIATGRSAGHHGVFDYWQRGPRGRFAPVNGSAVRVPRFWERLSERGVSSCVVNVPVTYPPQPIRGIVIAGQDAPGAHPSIASPRAVYRDLVGRFGAYQLKEIFPGGRRSEDYGTLLESAIEWQARVYRHLLSLQEWDLFICYFGAGAMAQHYFWGELDADRPDPLDSVVGRTYRRLDEAIAQLRSAAGADATTIVMSECGAGPLRSGVQINTLLEQTGLLSYRRPYRAGHEAASTDRRAVETVRRVGQRWLPKRLYYTAERLQLRSWIQSYLAESDIDWARTSVYYRGKGEGNLYVNLQGREAHGCVTPQDYDAVRERTIDGLQGLVDPNTGRAAIVGVHRREDLFAGPHVDLAPDLVIEWAEHAYMPTEQDRQKDGVFVERWREYMEWPTTGSHRMSGLFAAAGPAIGNGPHPAQLRLLDVAPTVCAMLGETFEDFEGSVAATLLSGNRSVAGSLLAGG